MATKAELIDDIILRITKGAPSDDLEISPRQIGFWFDIEAANVVPKYIAAQLKQNKPISSNLIKIDDDLDGQVEDVAMLNEYSDRVYIETTKPIMDVAGDRGILRIITEEGHVVRHVPLERLDTLNKMRMSRPTRDNMLWSRVNDKIYIHGLNPKHVNITSFSVAYIPKVDLSDLNPSDEVQLPDEVVSLISEAVYTKAAQQFGILPDIENDSEDDNTAR